MKNGKIVETSTSHTGPHTRVNTETFENIPIEIGLTPLYHSPHLISVSHRFHGTFETVLYILTSHLAWSIYGIGVKMGLLWRYFTINLRFCLTTRLAENALLPYTFYLQRFNKSV